MGDGNVFEEQIDTYTCFTACKLPARQKLVYVRGVGCWHHWGESNHARGATFGIKEELLDSSLSFVDSAHLFQKDTFPKRLRKPKSLKGVQQLSLKAIISQKKQI